MQLRIDGQLCEVMGYDMDGDGKADYNKTEKLTRKANIMEQEIRTSTEIGEGLDALNKDKLDDLTGMSSIDTISRLHPMEISAILVNDTLVGMNFLTRDCLILTRQKKRLQISEFGKGRMEMVSAMNGNLEHQENVGQGGIVNKIKSWMGGKK